MNNTNKGWEEEITKLVDEYATNWDDWDCLNDRLLELISKQRQKLISQTMERFLECRPEEAKMKIAVKTKSDVGAGWTIGHNVALDKWTDNIKALSRDTNNNKK